MKFNDVKRQQVRRSSTDKSRCKMELVYFRDTIEDGADPQYGILMDGDSPHILCLCCGGVLEYGDYKILKRLPWKDVSSLIKQNKREKYVVCIDKVYVRDAQYLDTKHLSQKAFDNLDYYDADCEELWQDMEPDPFVAIVEADSEKSACKIAAAQMKYDPRCLFAIKI